MQFDNYKLRLITKNDVHSFYKLIQNNLEKLEDTFAGTVSKTRTLEETKEFIDSALNKIVLKLYYPFVIIEKSSDNIIGLIDLKNINWDIPKTEIGYFIDSNYEGKGVSTRSLSAIVGYSFNELKMNKLFLRTTKSNIGSQRVAEKNGFEKEGFIKKDYKTTNGEVVDLIYYGLIPNES